MWSDRIDRPENMPGTCMIVSPMISTNIATPLANWRLSKTHPHP
jgi:hypothetical protein